MATGSDAIPEEMKKAVQAAVREAVAEEMKAQRSTGKGRTRGSGEKTEYDRDQTAAIHEPARISGPASATTCQVVPSPTLTVRGLTAPFAMSVWSMFPAKAAMARRPRWTIQE